MINKISDEAVRELIDVMAAYPNGIAVPDIEKKLRKPPPRRTLQYRLKQLVSSGRLRMEGSGRWVQYHPSNSQTLRQSNGNPPIFNGEHS